MKKSLALLLALVMLLGILAGCAASSTTEPAENTAETAAPAETTQTEEPAAESTETEEPAAKSIETLKVAFVPSREPQEIITATEPLKELLKTEHAKEGYDVGEVEITVGTTYEAVGEGLEAGTIDVGLIPGGTYVLYDDGAEVILTATTPRTGTTASPPRLPTSRQSPTAHCSSPVRPTRARSWPPRSTPVKS